MSRDVGAALARTSQAGQSADALALLDEVPLPEAEAGYVEAARAANTLRGYRSDWRESTTWAAVREVEVLPAAPATITGYLSDLAAAGAKVGTMSRLAGLRDRALILLGFVAALRRSEIAGIDVGDVAEHANGLVISIARSKTNQVGGDAELVVLPRAANPERCAVTAITRWRDTAGIAGGPLLRAIGKNNQPTAGRLHPESINRIIQAAIARAGIDPTTCSAHSLRAGFVTYAHLRGSSDRAIAHQTRHRSLTSVGTYVRVHNAWTDNAATTLGL